MKKLLANVNLEEVIEYVANGKDCKAEIDADGYVNVIPQNAEGYGDTILTLAFDAYDYEECDNAEEYKEFLNDAYGKQSIDADEYLVEIKF